MKYAAIDIGANSFHLLIVESPGTIIVDESRSIGLGIRKGRSGMLPPERIQEGIHALGELVEIARQHEVPVWNIEAVATSALKRAFNAKSVVEKIKHQLGLETHILHPEDEAKYAWYGAINSLQLPNGSKGIVNLTAGNLETVIGQHDRINQGQSFRLGYMSLSKEFFGEDPQRYNMQQVARMRNHIQQNLAQHKWQERPRSLVAVGDAAIALASIEKGLKEHQPHAVHGLRLSRGMLRKRMDRILESTISERAQICHPYPERANYLLVAACLLECICTSFMRDSLFVSSGGIRLAILLNRLKRDN